jgi:hypothetical protein
VEQIVAILKPASTTPVGVAQGTLPTVFQRLSNEPAKDDGGIMDSQPRDPVESIAAKYFLEYRPGQIQSTHLLALNAKGFAGSKKFPVPRVGGSPLFECFRDVRSREQIEIGPVDNAVLVLD